MRFVTQTTEPQPERVVSLRQDESGSVDVMIGGYYIVSINDDGTLTRHGAISADMTGLKLDGKGRIELDGGGK